MEESDSASFCQVVESSFCQVVESSFCQVVESSFCQVEESSFCQVVESSFCQVVESRLSSDVLCPWGKGKNRAKYRTVVIALYIFVVNNCLVRITVYQSYSSLSVLLECCR